MTIIDLQHETEEKLLLQIRSGNYQAFQELYDRHFDMLYGVAYNILREHSEAEDIIQDIFIWFWEHRSQWQLTSCKGYLLTAVKFKTASYFRKNKSREDFYKKLALQTSAELDASIELEIRQLKTLIQQSTSELPARCRQIFTLSRFEHLNNKEIAEKMGISEKTVEAQITIAIRKLRKNLGKASYVLFFFY
uniref:RNA polymerase sigma factor n=1 Tax=Pedobacter schmidteae TaxID=2201271 RepID=UPI000EACDA3D|nr:RNA polymerase sigma-70 factor [Pedobacter schmidteae]